MKLLTKQEKYELGCMIVTAMHAELYGPDGAIAATKENVVVHGGEGEKHLNFIKGQQERLEKQAMYLAESIIKVIEEIHTGDYQCQFRECKSLLGEAVDFKNSDTEEYVVPEKDEEGNYPYMKVSDLKKQIANIPGDMEVYIRCSYNPTGNIVEAGVANKGTYGSFGQSIPCLIIEPSYQDYRTDR